LNITFEFYSKWTALLTPILALIAASLYFFLLLRGSHSFTIDVSGFGIRVKIAASNLPPTKID
jgi:hypothetical protein